MEMELKPNYRGKLITFVAVREKQLARAEKLAVQLQSEGWQLCPVAEISQCQHEKVLFLFPEKEAFTPQQQTTFVRRLTLAKGLKEITIITTSPIILADAFEAKDANGKDAMRRERYFGAAFLVKHDLVDNKRSYADKYLDGILASDDLTKYDLAALEKLADQIGMGHYSFDFIRLIRAVKETIPPVCHTHNHTARLD